MKNAATKKTIVEMKKLSIAVFSSRGKERLEPALLPLAAPFSPACLESLDQRIVALDHDLERPLQELRVHVAREGFGEIVRGMGGRIQRDEVGGFELAVHRR